MANVCGYEKKIFRYLHRVYADEVKKKLTLVNLYNGTFYERRNFLTVVL